MPLTPRTHPVPASRSHVADWERTQKPRVWKGQFKLLLIALLGLISYLALPGLIFTTVHLLLNPTDGWQKWTLLCFIAFTGSLILGYILSSTVRCNLCQGSPMLVKKCRKHVLANKLPCLGYRASAILHLLFTGRFRCMYCSTPYRLGFKSDSSPPRTNR